MSTTYQASRSEMARMANQRHEALTKANAHRLAAAELKAEVRALDTSQGAALAADILGSPREDIGAMPVHALLTSVRGMGAAKANAMLRDVGMRNRGRRVRDLGDRERARLVEALAAWAEYAALRAARRDRAGAR